MTFHEDVQHIQGSNYFAEFVPVVVVLQACYTPVAHCMLIYVHYVHEVRKLGPSYASWAGPANRMGYKSRLYICMN